ncbi:TolC family protein [Paludisphaera sp.]|uniref:TolC family protein n=1 Tax=Paludisphaera sp. TaxID=2017432 RepID=UPI00301CB2FA
MQGRTIGFAAVLACALGSWTDAAVAQISLADDIIAAAKAKQSSEQQRRSALGSTPGTTESPYDRRPGATDINLGEPPRPRHAALPRLARLAGSTSAFTPRTQEPGQFEEGIAPSIERLPLALPEEAVPFRVESPTGYDEEGPPDGLALDGAIRRLVEVNRDLRIKALELPQADADILTAGLRENPLVFYGSDNVPYGSYSPERPGDVEHGISLILPIDYMGKREKRVDLAKVQKRVLIAQYQDAVRLAIDELYTAFVNALVARQTLRAAEDTLTLLDEVIRGHSAQISSMAEPSEATLEEMDDLTVERGVTEMGLQDAHDRYTKARHRLADLLELGHGGVEAMDLHGKINVPRPILPDVEALVATARERRPDLIAHRLGVSSARAEWMEERGERYSDAYFLFTPWNYLDRSQSNERSVSTWGAGVFVTLPLFNRNQGNVRRAEINVIQSEIESDVVEGQVDGEVRQAYLDLTHSLADLTRLEKETLPAVRRKRDKSRARLEAGEIRPEDYLRVQRQTTSLVRYYRDTAARNRRNMLRLNTAVGCRILP